MKIRINYPQIFRSTTIPERTLTIKSKNGKDYIESDFIGFYARRENPIELMNGLASLIEKLVDKLIKK